MRLRGRAAATYPPLRLVLLLCACVARVRPAEAEPRAPLSDFSFIGPYDDINPFTGEADPLSSAPSLWCLWASALAGFGPCRRWPSALAGGGRGVARARCLAAPHQRAPRCVAQASA